MMLVSCSCSARPTPRPSSQGLRPDLPEREAVVIEVLDFELEDAIRCHARRLKDSGASPLKLGVQVLDSGNVEVDVSLECAPFAAWQRSAADLEMENAARALDDGVDAKFVRRGLDDPIDWIEIEPEDVTIVLCCLPHVGNA
jgi:hypothetical protein